MSAKTMGLVWDMQLPQRDLLVLLALADHADHNGQNAFPSLALLAWKVGASAKTVSRALIRLKRAGIIEARPRAGKATVYNIYPERAPKKPPFKETDPGHNCVHTTPDTAMTMDTAVSPQTRYAKNGRGTPDTPSAKSATNHQLYNHQPTTTGVVGVKPLPAKATPDTPDTSGTSDARPNVYSMYESAFGMLLTATISERLREMAETYSEEWVGEALKITATSGRRGNLNYTDGILRRWQRDGKTERAPQPTGPTGIWKELS